MSWQIRVAVEIGGHAASANPSDPFGCGRSKGVDKGGARDYRAVKDCNREREIEVDVSAVETSEPRAAG